MPCIPIPSKKLHILDAATSMADDDAREFLVTELRKLITEVELVGLRVFDDPKDMADAMMVAGGREAVGVVYNERGDPASLVKVHIVAEVSDFPLVRDGKSERGLKKGGPNNVVDVRGEPMQPPAEAGQ